MYRSYTDPRSILIAAYSGALIGIDRYTGETKWKCVLPNAIEAVDFVTHGNHIYAAVYPGKVYCLDYFTGDIVWTTQFTNKESYEYHRPAILVDEAELFVMNWHGEIACLDLDGKVIWTHRQENTPSAPAFGLPGNVKTPNSRGNR